MSDQNQDHSLYNWTQDHLLEILTTGTKPRVTNPQIVDAIREIDRAKFIDKDFDSSKVYEDSQDDLGQGEFMESPVFVAEMLEALDLEAGQKVLEIGTGSGYVTALLARTVAPGGFVYSLERSQRLLAKARKNIANYKLENVELIFQNANNGLISKSPFIRIYSSVAYKTLPEAILTQLEIDGKMILPLENGEVKLVTRISSEDFEEEIISFQQLPSERTGVV